MVAFWILNTCNSYYDVKFSKLTILPSIFSQMNLNCKSHCWNSQVLLLFNIMAVHSFDMEFPWWGAFQIIWIRAVTRHWEQQLSPQTVVSTWGTQNNSSVHKLSLHLRHSEQQLSPQTVVSTWGTQNNSSVHKLSLTLEALRTTAQSTNCR